MALYNCRAGTSIFSNGNVYYDLTLNIRLSRRWRENWFRQSCKGDRSVCHIGLRRRGNLSHRDYNCDQQKRHSGDVCHVSTLPESSSRSRFTVETRPLHSSSEKDVQKIDCESSENCSRYLKAEPIPLGQHFAAPARARASHEVVRF